MAKRTVYGGIERQRISSQSFKAALRDNPTLVRTKDGKIVGDTMKHLAGSLGLDMSVRSALIGERKLEPALKLREMSAEDAKAWSDAIMALWQSEGATVDPNVPLVVGEKEIGALADACVALAKAKVKPEKGKESQAGGPKGSWCATYPSQGLLARSSRWPAHCAAANDCGEIYFSSGCFTSLTVILATAARQSSGRSASSTIYKMWRVRERRRRVA